MSVTSHTVMAAAATRASSLGASIVSASTPSAVRALINPATWVLVASLADLPAASGGVITLAADTTYVITTTVDLAGARIVASSNTAIIGGSSENCRLKSTGLAAAALITSAYSLPMRNVTLEAAIALALDATGNPGAALDWTSVNLTDCASCGTIRGYSNAVFTSCALLSSGGLIFDGAFNTVAFNQCIISPAAGQTAITVAGTATIARRFRVIYSAIVVPATATGIEVPSLAAFPTGESFILDTCAFTGLGTYLSGVSQADNVALFTLNTGIANSATVAQYYMIGNALGTSTVLQSTFYKIAGVTSSGDYVRKFTLTNNRATYAGVLAGFFRVTVVLSLADGNNQDIAVRVALDGVTLASSETIANTGAGGRASSVSVQAIVFLNPGQYVEVWAANKTSAGGTLTVSDLNVIVSRFS